MDVARDVLQHYSAGVERDRLTTGMGRLEELRTWDVLGRWLPPAPAVVLDVGGGPGHYATPLAAEGYDVHLLDVVPLHVEQARRTSEASRRPLASAQVADARALPFADTSADVVLLMGPLYHLVERADRLSALRESQRVLRPGGIVIVSAVSRFASALSGFHSGFLRQEDFLSVVAVDLETGTHHNPDNRPGWFTTAYFHHPAELTEEIAEAGLELDGPVALEGLGGAAPDIEGLLDDDESRLRVLDVLRRTEREPSLIGMSSHLMALGRRPSDQ